MGWKTRTPATAHALSTAAEDRIQKLVWRACRHSYGAESALRNAVKQGVAEMAAAGATPDTVRRVIAQCVENHPNSVSDKPSLLTGESRTAAVTKRMVEWAGEVLGDQTLRMAL